MTRKKKKLSDVYMTAREVEELFHVSQKTLYRWRKAGILKGGVKVGREYRYPTKEVQALLRSKEAQLVETIIKDTHKGKE